MGTLDDKLDYLKETKEQIRQAINSKGQQVSVSDTFRSYATKISAIENGDIITATNTTGSAISANDKIWIEPQNTNPVTYNIILSKDVTSTSFTAIAQASIADNASGSVKTILNGNGTYAPILGTKVITRNNTYSASTDDLYGYSSVTVNVEDIPAVVESLSVIPSAITQTFTPTTGIDGYAPVIVSGDANLIAGNIKSGVEIFGVTGDYSGTVINNQNKSVTPSALEQQITADSGYTGLGTVTVSGDADLIASNIKSGVNIFGVTGSYEGTVINNQNKSINIDGSYTADAGYTGLGTVTVTAGAVASLETQNQIAEQLMIINDGPCTLTVTITPSNANFTLTSDTNSVIVSPTSSSGGVHIYTISIDPLKTYSYSASASGYYTRTGTIAGGTTTSTISLNMEVDPEAIDLGPDEPDPIGGEV